MFKFLSITLLVLTPLASFAQAPVTQCETYAFQCNWNIYQCGKSLSFPEITFAPDSCTHGSWPAYRPIPDNDCARLIGAVTTGNYTGAGLAFNRIRCRETHLNSSSGFGTGDTLSSWGCYNSSTNTSLIMTSSAPKVQNTCVKDKSYFTRRDPFIGRDQKCACGSSNPTSTNCTGVVPGSQCEPGLICTQTGTTYSACKTNPMADHVCCHSLNHVADDVKPGTCCLGGRAENGKCVAGLENKTVAYTGICNSTDIVPERKSAIMEGNMCFQTPDRFNRTAAQGYQGDCMIGLKCEGTKGVGTCRWWDIPLYRNSSNLRVWTRGCEPGDCQAGTYCFLKYAANNQLQFSECRPQTPGMIVTEGHNGLTTTPLSQRIFKQSLGRCVGGIVGTVWGDPHVITFDKLTYDCMGAGDYILTENCLFRLHGRFDGMEERGMTVSQTKAFAIQTGHSTPNVTSDDSLLQLYFPHKWEQKMNNITAGAHQVYQGNCPVRILLNGQVLERPPVGADNKLLNNTLWKQTPLLNITTLVVKNQPGQASGDFYIVDYANGGTARFRITGSGAGCVMSVDLCLPDRRDECYPNAIGLMGTPDGDRANDWMAMVNGTKIVLPANQGGVKGTWNYCTDNWCVQNGTRSILPVANTGIPGVMSREFYAAECDRAYPGDLDLTFCYPIARCDKFLGKDQVKGVTPQAQLSSTYRSCCIECIRGADDPNCKGEENTILDIEENTAVTPDGKTSLLPPVALVTCSNLGTDLSDPTGVNAWTGTSQSNVQCGEVLCAGYDDSWSVFVAGDLSVKRAELIEGRTYVGGTFKTFVTSALEDSLKYMGWAPCGSKMCPNTMKSILEVCGNIDLGFGVGEKVDVMVADPSMAGYIKFGGTFRQNGVLTPMTDLNGERLIVNSTMINVTGMIAQAQNETKNQVCAKKVQTLAPLKVKAEYWASANFKSSTVHLAGTVTVNETGKEVVLNGPPSGTGCIVVFDLDGAVLNRGNNSTGWKIVFGEKITGAQTVLINVAGTNVAVKGFESMESRASQTASAGYHFENSIMTKTLWNFYQATTVTIGSPSYTCTSQKCLASGTPDDATSFDWQGSILAPIANVDWYIKAHYGRMVVGGRLTIDHPLATFYNYMFKPTSGDQCELPKAPGDTCTPVELPPAVPGLEPNCGVESYINTDTGSNICKTPTFTESIVRLDGEVGYDGSSFIKGDGVIYGIKFSPDGKSVKFNVNNPFDEPADVYVKHDKFFPGTTWLDPTCEAVFDKPHCIQSPFSESGAREFEVACMTNPVSNKTSAQVYVYFATDDVKLTTYAGTKLNEIDACCHPPDYDQFHGFAEFMFRIDCACPPASVGTAAGNAARKLRG